MSLVGPAGPAGPQGPAGPAGLQGPQGIGAPTDLAMYGNGSAGDVTLTADATLAANTYYNSLTIGPGVTLYAKGFRIYCRHVLTNNGIISCRGGNATGSTAGANAYPGGALGTSGAGGNGMVGAGQNAPSMGNGLQDTNGHTGGDGGDAPGPLNGGSGQSASTNIVQGARYFPGCVQGKAMTSGGNTYLVRGGGGGGGGAGVGGSGGGGGGGGGVIMIAARSIINTGTITAEGGNGADALGGDSGGGGFGGGGVILLTYDALTDTGLITAADGYPGAKSGAGSGAEARLTGLGVIAKVANR